MMKACIWNHSIKGNVSVEGDALDSEVASIIPLLQLTVHLKTHLLECVFKNGCILLVEVDQAHHFLQSLRLHTATTRTTSNHQMLCKNQQETLDSNTTTILAIANSTFGTKAALLLHSYLQAC